MRCNLTSMDIKATISKSDIYRTTQYTYKMHKILFKNSRKLIKKSIDFFRYIVYNKNTATENIGNRYINSILFIT
ncbi:MAG: hypothetical protein ACI4PK_00690 [Oscillospiraceae bacterium]